MRYALIRNGTKLVVKIEYKILNSFYTAFIEVFSSPNYRLKLDPLLSDKSKNYHPL